jgi:hypothetical protein
MTLPVFNLFFVVTLRVITGLELVGRMAAISRAIRHVDYASMMRVHKNMFL